jgi:hypothetical protein
MPNMGKILILNSIKLMMRIENHLWNRRRIGYFLLDTMDQMDRIARNEKKAVMFKAGIMTFLLSVRNSVHKDNTRIGR